MWNDRPAAPRSILVLHAGTLGDCVLAIHVIRALRSSDGAVRVILAARSSIARWAARSGIVDEATTPEAVGIQALFQDSSAASGDCRFPIADGRLNRQRDESGSALVFDYVVGFLGGPAEKVSRRLFAIFGRDRVAVVDPRPTKTTLRDGVHITEQWTAAIHRQGFDFKSQISDLRSTSHRPMESEHSRKTPPTPRFPPITKLPNYQIARSILVHPGSGGRAKCCPIEAMEALVDTLLHRGYAVSWMIGPDEMERDGPGFRKRLEASAPVAYEESVAAAADIVARADAFIGNDAGMTHVAALASVNTVSLFGPTDPRVWRPLGPRCRVGRFPVPGESTATWADSIVEALEAAPSRYRGPRAKDHPLEGLTTNPP